MPANIVSDLKAAGHEVTETDDMEAGLQENDTVYLTRIQEERFDSKLEADIYRGRFRLNQAIYTRHCQPNTVIMHPLPRDSRAEANELDADLNQHPNLAIFRQADNGVLIRMALFALILDISDKIKDSTKEIGWYTGGRFGTEALQRPIDANTAGISGTGCHRYVRRAQKWRLYVIRTYRLGD